MGNTIGNICCVVQISNFQATLEKQFLTCFSGTTIVPTSGSGAVTAKNGIKGSAKRDRLCRILA